MIARGVSCGVSPPLPDPKTPDRRSRSLGVSWRCKVTSSRAGPCTTPSPTSEFAGTHRRTHQLPSTVASMASTRLLLIRHAQADPEGRLLLHACEGLTDEGRTQARRLAARLVLEGPFDAVLASKAARAVQTAEIVASSLGLGVAETTCDLCEMHPGAAEGMTYDEMTRAFGPTYRDVPGAVHYPDWIPEARASLTRIATDYTGRSVVCITHNGMVKASLEVLGAMPHIEAEVSASSHNTGITEWVCPLDPEDRRSGVWSLARFNDAGHLLDASGRYRPNAGGSAGQPRG
jgi:broad specificity phosphatase PhoE